MANIVLQDLTAIIHATSRGIADPTKAFDLVHVETLLQTSEPLAPTANWFVPNNTYNSSKFDTITPIKNFLKH